MKDCAAIERERIIKQLNKLGYIDQDGHEMISEFKTDLIALIKDPTRNIRSEILPDGTIYIEEIKGEK